MFKDWTWQKWVSRLSKAIVAIVAVVFKLIAPEAEPEWMPSWWIVLSPIFLLLVDTILGLFPPKPAA